jgi:hypothetical protein
MERSTNAKGSQSMGIGKVGAKSAVKEKFSLQLSRNPCEFDFYAMRG